MNATGTDNTGTDIDTAAENAAEIVGAYPHRILLDSRERRQLRDAAEVIRKRGIAHKMFVDHDGRVCAAGALDRVQSDHARFKLVWNVLDDILTRTRRMSLTFWNDERDLVSDAYVRTAEDVAALFLAVADRAERDAS